MDTTMIEIKEWVVFRTGNGSDLCGVGHFEKRLDAIRFAAEAAGREFNEEDDDGCSIHFKSEEGFIYHVGVHPTVIHRKQ
jgi:hypothetical protein